MQDGGAAAAGDGLSAAQRAEVLIDIHGVRRMRTAGSKVATNKAGRTLTRAQYLGEDAHGQLLLPMSELTYGKVAYYYRWVGRTWQRRSQPHFAADVVGRVTVLTPKAGDAFYMRLLLMSPCSTGACDHGELRTPCRHSGERPLRARVRVLPAAAADVHADTSAVPVGTNCTIVGFSRDGRRRIVEDGQARASFAKAHLEMLPCDTYKHACQLEGLLADDSLWRATMLDGVGTMRPAQLRDLFVSILLYSEVGQARALWDEFRDDLSADFARRRGDEAGLNELDPACDESDYNCTLGELHHALQLHGAALADFNLPAYDAKNDRRGRNAEQRAEYYDNEGELRERWIEGVANLNVGQHTAWDALRADVHEVWEIDQRVREPLGLPPLRAKLHFVWGRGGSGKTFLDQLLLDYVRSGGEDRAERRVAIAVASSGIAALLLEGGRTVHSRFKVPINLLDPGVRANVKAQSNLAALLREAVLILWDEATMLSKEVLIILNTMLQDVMRNNLPFGGKMVVLTGDWRQTLPIARGRADTVNATHLMSDFWPMCHVHELTTNMRIERLRRSDPAAAARLAAHDEWLLQVGEGSSGADTVDVDGVSVDDTRRVVLPEEMTFRGGGLDEFLNYMYPGFAEHAAAIDVLGDAPVEQNAWARCVLIRRLLHSDAQHIRIGA